jgi:hypothetical protein
VPFAASCVYGLLAVAAHGSPEQRDRLLPGIAEGTVVVAGAISGQGSGSGVRTEAEARADTRADTRARAEAGSEAAGSGPAREPMPGKREQAPGTRESMPGTRDSTPGTRERRELVPRTREAAPGRADRAPGAREQASGRLTGVVPVVPWLRDATHVLVADDRRGLWLVRTAEAAASEPVELTAPWSAGRLTLDGTPGEALGAEGAYDDLLATARTAFAGLQAGVCAGSLARAVEHTNAREQFGRPLAAKQGVQLRAADAYMDTEAIRVTAYEAAWRRDEGLPYATHALTAAWWASEAGQRVVHTGQHLHGGAGADLEHPVHRHFLWGRQLDAYLGCGGELLQELGELIANGEAET